ncbi:hypothetical protein PIB30_029909 [Stylosanthes scabra]|uniref:Uncharacterized protein n=1 Tax=Stylosanthes scabra TaxID=79078 RepID=A0ABU6SB10_9FABA|nr:hypothetical protein [Stylosanthes scabra]
MCDFVAFSGYPNESAFRYAFTDLLDILQDTSIFDMRFLMARASAAKGDVHDRDELEVVKSLPSLSLMMTNVALLQEDEKRAASILSFVHPTSGGCKIDFLYNLLAELLD